MAAKQGRRRGAPRAKANTLGAIRAEIDRIDADGALGSEVLAEIRAIAGVLSARIL